MQTDRGMYNKPALFYYKYDADYYKSANDNLHTIPHNAIAGNIYNQYADFDDGVYAQMTHAIPLEHLFDMYKNYINNGNTKYGL